MDLPGNRIEIFPGQYYDQETGFHYNYHRYYDPRSGRYLTPDPIGLAGGINPYVYAENNSINKSDPFGLDTSIVVSRGISSNLSTPGTITVTSTELAGRFEGHTLEPAQGSAYSRIAPGTYRAYQRDLSVDRRRQYDPPRIHLLGASTEAGQPMPGAEIHVGNTPRDTSGCILVGADEGTNQIFTIEAAMEAINVIIDADGGVITVTITDCEPTTNCE